MRGRETCPYLLHERIVAGVEHNGTPERRGRQNVLDDVAYGPGCRYFADGEIVICTEDRDDMTGTTRASGCHQVHQIVYTQPGGRAWFAYEQVEQATKQTRRTIAVCRRLNICFFHFDFWEMVLVELQQHVPTTT